MTTPFTGQQIAAKLRQEYGAELIHKDESALHLALSWVMFWTWSVSLSPWEFTRTYMTRYTSVIGSTIALPIGRDIDDPSMCAVLCHEAQHMQDFKERPYMYLAYVLPQLLAVPGLLALVPGWSWWWLCLMLAIFLPSPSRTWIEFRGYCVSLTWLFATSGRVNDESLDRIVRQFTGPTYLWMWPFEQHIRGLFRKRIASLEAGENPTELWSRRILLGDLATS